MNIVTFFLLLRLFFMEATSKMKSKKSRSSADSKTFRKSSSFSSSSMSTGNNYSTMSYSSSSNNGMTTRTAGNSNSYTTTITGANGANVVINSSTDKGIHIENIGSCSINLNIQANGITSKYVIPSNSSMDMYPFNDTLSYDESKGFRLDITTDMGNESTSEEPSVNININVSAENWEGSSNSESGYSTNIGQPQGKNSTLYNQINDLLMAASSQINILSNLQNLIYNQMSNIHVSSGQNSTTLPIMWMPLYFKGIDISVSTEGNLIAVGENNVLYKYNRLLNQFMVIGDQEMKTFRVSSTFGVPYIVGENATPFYLGQNGSWISLDGCANDISVGKTSNDVYKIGCDLTEGGFTVYKLRCTSTESNNIYQTCNWESLERGGENIEVDFNGYPVVITDNGNILRYIDNQWENFMNITGKDISFANNAIAFLVNVDSSLSAINYLSSPMITYGITGLGKKIAAGSDGELYYLDINGNLYTTVSKVLL